MKSSNILKLIGLLILLGLLVLVSACSAGPTAPTDTPIPPSPTPSSVPTEEAGGPAAEISGLGEISSIEDIATIAAQRTPMPTRVPSLVQEAAQEIASETGLDDISFLGWTLTTWIDLAISLLIIVLLVYIGLKLLIALLKFVVRRTKTAFDDEVVDYIEPQLRWLIVIIVTGQAAVTRLDFLSDGVRLILEDVFFLLALAFIYIIVLRLIHFGTVWYRRKKLTADQRRQLDPFIETLKRLAYILASVLLLSSALSHFGIEIGMLTAIILFAAVVVILGARAAISDAISGFIILVSQPFRINDTIFITELKTRGIVDVIGIRTTHIGTRDGREVIVPNSLIGASRVINYTYPDPNFRVEMDFLTNGGDIDLIHEIITQTVRGVEGVLDDKLVDVLYLAYGGTGRQFRVRWWIDDVNQHNRSRDKVNKALDRALSEAGIGSPNIAYDLNLNVVGDDGRLVAKVLSEESDKDAE